MRVGGAIRLLRVDCHGAGTTSSLDMLDTRQIVCGPVVEGHHRRDHAPPLAPRLFPCIRR
jgi:hypothetical protein